MRKTSKHNMAYDFAYSFANTLVNKIIIPEVGGLDIIIVGSLRRKKDTVNDIDLLAFGISPENDSNIDEPPEYGQRIADVFKMSYDDVDIFAVGNSKVRASLNGVQIDMNIFYDPLLWGSQMLHHTGSAQNNILMRKEAIKRGFSLSQNGLVNRETKKLVASETEEAIFKALEMDFILVEDR